MEIIERIPVGENSHGYSFEVGSILAEDDSFVWVGYAHGAGMLFILPGMSEEHVLGLKDRDRAIRLTGAIAQSAEHGYGGVDRWFVDESLRGRPEDFTCESCQGVGCPGDCD